MSASTAIGMVSESLHKLLEEEMLLDDKKVTILAPDEPGGDRRINLFLYRVQENTTLKNIDWQIKPGQPTQLLPPPLSLNLFYLMTAYAPNDSLIGNATAHAILGEAMRVFHENPIVPQQYLVSELQDAREQIKIMLNPLDLEELARVWSTFAQPFRLSVMYEVSVVQLDMVGERPMPKRVERVGAPEVRAPFSPPVVHRLTPLRGPAGTSIAVEGQGLTGWRASVSVGGARIVDGAKLTQDILTANLPGDLPVGFYEVRIDIAHLHRRLFFFEVTA